MRAPADFANATASRTALADSWEPSVGKSMCFYMATPFIRQAETVGANPQHGPTAAAMTSSNHVPETAF